MNNEFDILATNLNDIFKDFNFNVKESLKDIKVTRKGKIEYSDVLYYKLFYAFNNKKKQSIVSKFNFETDKTINRSTFHKKSFDINLQIYKDLFNKVRDLHNKEFRSTDTNKLIAVDGTYNNTNINNIKNELETNLNLVFFSIKDCVPLDITYCGSENKNKEILKLKEYITDTKLNDESTVYILDRAYYSYDFLNFLNGLGLKYVVRLRNNSKLIRYKNKILNDSLLINKDENEEINHVFRIAKHETIFKNKETINNTIVRYSKTTSYNLITNLDDSYTDDDIKDLYKHRWDVEIFIMFLKSNFQFSKLNEHHEYEDENKTKEEYDKHYYLILIINYILAMIEKIAFKFLIPKPKIKSKFTTKKKKNKHEYKHNINKTLLIDGIQLLIYNIAKGNVTKNDFSKLSKTYVKFNNVCKDRYNKRSCKTPNTKWYIKGHSKSSELKSILTNLIDIKNKVEEPKELNNNLRSKSKNYKIHKIIKNS